MKVYKKGNYLDKANKKSPVMGTLRRFIGEQTRIHTNKKEASI